MPSPKREPSYATPSWDRDPQPLRQHARRIQALRQTDLLDTGPEESFDRLTRLAARLLNAPATFFSLVDEHRDFFKSCFGFPEPIASARQVSSPSFCEYAIMSHAPLVLNDVTKIPVLCDIPQVAVFGIRAYIGIPMVTASGEIIGSFCAVDMKTREWTANDVEVMQELAESANREISLRNALARAERHTDRANQSVRAREEVLAVVAHDLRAPLGVIANSAHLLAQLDMNGLGLDSLNSLRAATTSMAGLINDLLDVSQFDAGHLKLHLQPIRPETLIHDAVGMMSPIAARNGIALIDATPPGLPAVEVDYERILRVFSNLISNAIKFSNTDTTVRVAATRVGNQVRFEVSDRGTGMTPEQISQMFTKFWQADVTDRRGAGLGLPIAREIIEAHGGTIDAVSASGVGSTLRFTLAMAAVTS